MALSILISGVHTELLPIYINHPAERYKCLFQCALFRIYAITTVIWKPGVKLTTWSTINFPQIMKPSKSIISRVHNIYIIKYGST